MVKPPFDLDGFSPLVLKPLTLGVLEENARLSSENTALRDEVARLKGLKGKPDIKPPSGPSGMERATEKRQRRWEKRRRGPKRPSTPVEERVIAAAGRTVLAPLPVGIDGHFGPEIKRFILAQYHQG